MGPASPPLASPQEVWSTPLDGEVYASPLVVQGHVLVATENDTVYSLDLFTGSVVWKAHLGTPVAASSLPCGDIGPVSGITGTPAVDVGGGRVYAVAYLQGHHHMLFGLSLVDGSVAMQRDVDPAGSDVATQQQRGALAVGSGFVYVPLGGLYGDCGVYHGYVVGVPVAGGGGVSGGSGGMSVYRVPSARGAGVWSAAGVALDGVGNVYVTTGNSTVASPSFDFSNAVVELSPDLKTVRSYFAPADWAALDAGDVDLGSAGPALVGGAGAGSGVGAGSGSGSGSGDVLAVGKDGVAYLLRAGALGGVGGQVAARHVCAGAFGGTAVVGSVVFVPCTDGLVAVSVAAGAPAGLSVLWRAPHPLLGSPIFAAGVLWAIEPATAVLYALDPADGRVVFTHPLGAATHFSTPAATDGFVIAPAGRSVVGILTAG